MISAKSASYLAITSGVVTNRGTTVGCHGVSVTQPSVTECPCANSRRIQGRIGLSY